MTHPPKHDDHAKAGGAPARDTGNPGANDRDAGVVASAPQPLAGLRVVEFTHMVMGPTCGMVLADLGAEVIKVEPIDGDATRRLLGAGAGFFPMFNRNKKSIGVDLRQPAGAEVARRLAASADVVAENFKPGALGKFGLDYATLSGLNERLIYVSHKGFLPGPYEHRTALDEVVQMMGGLAYMTGRPGDPLRAGTSVNDIMGGMFGAIGALGALIQRGITGRGMEVQSALFENNVFLIGQHMLQYAMTGRHPAPMPARESPWAVYDVFTVQGRRADLPGRGQRRAVQDLLRRARLRRPEGRPVARDEQRPRAGATNAAGHCCASAWRRVPQPSWPRCSSRRACRSRRSADPRTCYDDPHLQATGGLADVVLPDGDKAGQTVKTTLFPLTMRGDRLPVRLNPPRLGEHTAELLGGVGYAPGEIDALRAARAVS